MSFDVLRRHRRKVEIPVAIVVVVTFALFFGSASIFSVFQNWRNSPNRDLSAHNTRMYNYGMDLVKAGFDRYPPEAKTKDEEEQIRKYYIESGERNCYMPMVLAERLGVTISDDELSDRLSALLTGPEWNINPNGKSSRDEIYKAYVKRLQGRNLSPARFEELFRAILLRQRIESLLADASAPSEADIFAVYAATHQQLRVQYVQRRAADFVAEVEEASKKEPPEPVKVEQPKADGQKPAAEQPKSKGVSAFDVHKEYDDSVASIKRAARMDGSDKDKNLEFSEYIVGSYPEYFSDERAQVEYLVASRSKFAKGITVTPERVQKFYDDNKKVRYEAPPAKDAKPGDAPTFRPLDEPLKAEITKELAESDALDAAHKAINAAVDEYNHADKDKRPALGALAAKHKLEHFVSVLGKQEDLEEVKFLEEAADKVFSAESRKAAGDNFFAPLMAKENEKDLARGALVAVRVAKFEPRRLLGFEEVKGAIRERKVLEKANELAEAALKEDAKKLAAGQLDAKSVRTSVLLESGTETWYMAQPLSIGEASQPFAYSELLGDEAAAEKAKKERKKDAHKHEKPSVADQVAKGWRVVVLAERKLPTIDEFRKDQAWRGRWAPSIPSWIYQLPLQYQQQMMQKLQSSGDRQWRSYYIEGWRDDARKRL